MTDQMHASHTVTARDRQDGSRSATETRAGNRTTEFILTLVAAAAVVIASYVSGDGWGSFPIRWGWLLFTVLIAAYVVSRGIAKAGSREWF